MIRTIVTGLNRLQNFLKTFCHLHSSLLERSELIEVKPVVDCEDAENKSYWEQSGEELDDPIISRGNISNVVKIVLLPSHILLIYEVPTIHWIQYAR